MSIEPGIREAEDFIIITNSPGEVSSWVSSTTRSLKNLKPEARIVVMLVPCPYATGREKDIAHSFPQVDLVITPPDYIRLCLGLRVKSYAPARKGIVLFLGGDFWHALWIARKLKFPAAAYTVRNSGWNRYFAHHFVMDDSTRQKLLDQGIPEEKIEVVGNLMRDGVEASINRAEALAQWGLSPDKLTVGIFPGSRLSHIQQSLSVFLKVAEELHAQIPDIQFMLSLSPYIDMGEIEKTLKEHDPGGIEGSSGNLVKKENFWVIDTHGGVTIPILKDNQYNLINASDLVLTIPGTNTAEIAALGKPMVVSFSWKVRLPRGGVGYLLNYLPLHWQLRRTLMHIAFQKIKFKALPNQWADREIVPEVKLEHKAEELTRVALNLLRDEEKRDRISRELIQVLGAQGAADKIAQRIALL
jgi:hypothetical protein